MVRKGMRPRDIPAALIKAIIEEEDDDDDEELIVEDTDDDDDSLKNVSDKDEELIINFN